MKIKIILTMLILFGAINIFGQAKENESIKSESQTIEREKFDPLRNPADDLAAAIEKAQAENKRIILDVGGEWCIWCRWMDEYFIKNSELTKLRDENFVWLKVNMSEENENREFLSRFPPAKGYPHLYVLESDGAFLHSQPTGVLEKGKSYDLQKFTDFFKKWSSSRNPADSATSSTENVRNPSISINEVLTIASNYVEENSIDISDKYINSVIFFRETSNKNYWLLNWSSNRFSKGGGITMKIFADKTIEIIYGK